MNDYLKLIDPKLFRDPTGIHGISHTIRVLNLVTKITEKMQVSEKDKNILSLAAVYHDIGRVHDGKDNNHGYLSFDKVKSLDLLKDYTTEDVSYIRMLIELHAIDDDEAIKRIKKYSLDFNHAYLLLCIFKDADGLDRVRLGSGDLDPSYLRTTAAVELIDFAQDQYYCVKN